MTRVLFIVTILTVCIFMKAQEGFADFLWREVGRKIAESDFQTLLIDPTDPNTLYVGTGKSLYQSKDGGRNWRNVLSVPGEERTVHFLAVVPQDPKTIFAATEAGLYKTSDEGETWERLFRGVGEFSRRAFCVLLDTENSERVYLGTGEGLFVSSDGGRQFKRDLGRLSRLPIIYLAQDPTDPKEIFAVTSEGLFRSLDQGGNWERVFVTATDGEASEGGESFEENGETLVAGPEQITAIAFSPQDSSHVFLSSVRGLYHSLDSGQTWERFTEIGLVSSEVQHLVFYDQTLVVATAEGIYRFSEKEKRWERLRSGFLSEKGRFLTATKQGDLWAVMEEGLYVGREMSFSSQLGADKETKELLAYFSNEPTIHEIQQAAIRYAEVNPEKILAWRRAASRKAWLPTVSTGIDVDIDRNIAVDTGGTTNPDFFIVGPDERGFGWDISASWDLGELVWNQIRYIPTVGVREV